MIDHSSHPHPSTPAARALCRANGGTGSISKSGGSASKTSAPKKTAAKTPTATPKAQNKSVPITADKVPVPTKAPARTTPTKAPVKRVKAAPRVIVNVDTGEPISRQDAAIAMFGSEQLKVPVARKPQPRPATSGGRKKGNTNYSLVRKDEQTQGIVLDGDQVGTITKRTTEEFKSIKGGNLRSAKATKVTKFYVSLDKRQFEEDNPALFNDRVGSRSLQGAQADLKDRLGFLTQKQVESPSTANKPARGKNLIASQAGLERVSEQVRKMTGGNEYGSSPSLDASLTAISKIQGFDAKPALVSKAEMDALIADGATPVYRGVKPKGGKTAKQFLDSLRGKPDSLPYEIGTGIYGNGVYFSESDDTAEGFASTYGVKDPRSGVIRGVIRPDAKTVDYDSLVLESKQAVEALYNERERNNWEPPMPEWFASRRRMSLVQDPGRYAAMQGYDVVLVSDRHHDGFNAAPQKVVLNRSVLILEDS